MRGQNIGVRGEIKGTLELSFVHTLKSYVCMRHFLCFLNPYALRTDKTLWSFGRSECSRVNYREYNTLGWFLQYLACFSVICL